MSYSLRDMNYWEAISGPDTFVANTEFVFGVWPQHLIKHNMKESPIDLIQKHIQAYKKTAIETKGVIIKNDTT